MINIANYLFNEVKNMNKKWIKCDYCDLKSPEEEITKDYATGKSICDKCQMKADEGIEADVDEVEDKDFNHPK